MWGSAKRKYIKPGHQIKVGETWSIDSGMGGSFTVEFQGGIDWKVITKYFERDITIKDEDRESQFFILVPA